MKSFKVKKNQGIDIWRRAGQNSGKISLHMQSQKKSEDQGKEIKQQDKKLWYMLLSILWLPWPELNSERKR